MNSQQWTQEHKVTRILIQASRQRQWNCVPLMVIKIHIAAETLLRKPKDQTRHAVIISELFMKLDDVINGSFEVIFAKAQIGNKEPTVVEFFVLQWTKMWLLEFYYKLSTKLYDVKKIQDLEMNKYSLYPGLAEEELEDWTWPELEPGWERKVSFAADSVGSFFHKHAVSDTEKLTNQSPGFWKRSWDAQRCYVYRTKLTATMMLPRTSFNSVAKVSTNVYWNRKTTVPRKCIPASRTKKRILRQQTEVSAWTIIC